MMKQALALLAALSAAAHAAVLTAPEPLSSARIPGIAADMMIGQTADLLRSSLLTDLTPTPDGKLLAPNPGDMLLEPQPTLQPGDHELIAAYLLRAARATPLAQQSQAATLILGGASDANHTLPAALFMPAFPTQLITVPGKDLSAALSANPSSLFHPRSIGPLMGALEILRQSPAVSRMDDAQFAAVSQEIFHRTSRRAHAPETPMEAPSLILPAGYEAAAEAPPAKSGLILASGELPALAIRMDGTATLAGKDGDAALGMVFGNALAKIFAADAAGDSAHYNSQNGLYLPGHQSERVLDVILQMQRLTLSPLASFLAKPTSLELDQTTLRRRLRALGQDDSLASFKILREQSDLFPGVGARVAKRLLAAAVARTLKKEEIPPLRPLGAFRLGDDLYFTETFVRNVTPAQMAAAILALRLGAAGLSEQEIEERTRTVTEAAFHKAVSFNDLRKLAPRWGGTLATALAAAQTDNKPPAPSAPEPRISLAARLAPLAALLSRALPFSIPLLAAVGIILESVFRHIPFGATQIYYIAALSLLNIFIVRAFPSKKD